MKNKIPRIIIFVQGGVVQDVMSDQAVTLRIIDYDVEPEDKPDFIHLVEADNKLVKKSEACRVIKYDLKGEEDLEPFFKQKAIK